MKAMEAVDGEHAEHEEVQREDARFGSVHGLALILLAAAVTIAPLALHRGGMSAFVAAYAIAALAWIPLAGRRVPSSAAIVLALALRFALLFPPPLLSGDVYRYLSDGQVVASGGNPYTYTPADPRINHREIRSIYPPHAQLLFGLVHDLTAWRLLVIAADVGVILLLRGRGFAYATCPLVLLEGTWSGHLDVLAGALVALAFVAAARAGSAGRTPQLPSIALALAAGLKVIPLAAAPALFRRRAKPLLFLLVLALPFIPFAGEPIMPGLRDYATRWIFNSPLYAIVRWTVERVPAHDLWTHHPLRFEAISDFVYRFLYPDFLTRAVLGTIFVAIVLRARLASSAIAALLFCSPTIHPWYWLTLAACSLIERTPWIWFALAAPLSYLLYDDVPAVAVYAICYGLPAFACAAPRSFSSPSRSST